MLTETRYQGHDKPPKIVGYTTNINDALTDTIEHITIRLNNKITLVAVLYNT